MDSLNKQGARKRFLELRDGISPQSRKAFSARISESVLSFAEKRKVSRVMVYAAFRSEVETEDLIRSFLARGYEVALPVCGKEGQMTSYYIDFFESLSQGAFGILEPPQKQIALPEDFDLILVPGCGFGRDMSRLGYGGGYYDRYLPLCINGVKLGLCFDVCLADSLPAEHFDVKMDGVITEKEEIFKV